MRQLQQLFQAKQNNILNIYCTAGYPHLNSTLTVMESLQKAGVDIIELGIPYSDPIADGPIIQASNAKAIENGITIKVIFQQLQGMKERIDTPVILMGYLNPIIQYGFEKFCSAAAACGVSGLIIPDLPPYEFEHQYKHLLEKFALDFIFLITPETSESRIQYLDHLSSGFLYAVSSSATTGNGNKMDLILFTTLTKLLVKKSNSGRFWYCQSGRF
jgi:tryptophan synthase alpha chain